MRKLGIGSAAFGALLALAATAFAHGGKYQPPAHPSGPVPREPTGADPGGADSGGPNAGGGSPSGPTTGGPSANGGSGSGPTTGGGVLPPPPPRHVGKTAAGGFSPDHWTRWWYANRLFLLDVSGRVSDNQSATPGAAPSADADAKWRGEVRDALLAALADRDEDVSSGAAVALGKGGDDAATAPLTKLLLDGSRQQAVREAAALGLGLLHPTKETSSQDARLGLQRVATEGTPERLRAFAVYGLGLRGDVAALPFLLDLSQKNAATWDVATACASSLGLAKCAMAREDLEALLAGPRQGKAKERMRRVYAAHGLARLGDAQSIPALRAAVDDDDEDVRRGAILALGALAKPDDKDTAELLAHEMRQDRDRACRNMAAIGLGRVGFDRSEKELRWYYENSHALEQPFAALALGLLARRGGKGDVVKMLVRELEERENVDLRSALCVAIGLSGDLTAAPVVRKFATGHGDPEVRAQAAAAIGLLGDHNGAPILREMLSEPASPALPREAAFALGLLGDAEAVKILLGLVQNGQGVYIQGAAALALGHIGGPDASQALVKLLGDRSRPGVARGMAAVALGLLVDRTQGRGIASVCADLDWYALTPTAQEAMDIL